MEAVLGIILFLQVVVSIQIMLVRKQMLQKIEQQETNTKRIREFVEVLNENECVKEMLQNPQKLLHNMHKEKEKIDEKQEESPEQLLNQVLSEVFS